MKKSQENLVLTQKHPAWLDTKISNSAFDEDLFQIILFYVFYSPCPKYSTQGRTLQFYGWNEKPWKTNRSMFHESEYVIDKALEYLKKSHLIVYQNHGKNSWWDVYADNAEKCFAKAERTE